MQDATSQAASRWPTLLAVVAIASCVGCGNGLASVSGTVTLDGNPLAGGGGTRAVVYFYPEGGTGAPAVGLLDSSGEFTVSTGTSVGAKPGAYLVTVSASQLVGKDTPGFPRSARRITPPMYADPNASGLRVEVASGSNDCEFALESAPPGRQRQRRRSS